MSRSRFLSVVVSISILLPSSAAAIANIFKDVPDGFVYKEQIETLVQAGVIHGNPDGTFRPYNDITRAELLKLAYLADRRQPAPALTRCFADVERYSWYEDIVCDAAANHLVQGVGEDKFDPARPVTRVEALKMIMQVMDIQPDSLTAADKALIPFTDLIPSAWYMSYVATAYKHALLPIAGQATSNTFLPNKTLLRGEAAAYIVSALQTKARLATQAQQSIASSFASSSSSKASAPEPISKTLQFPFTDADRFFGKQPTSYVFDITKQTVINVRAVISPNYTSDLTCRLYLIDADGYSSEYYLGMREKKSCSLRTSVRPGKYQLQLQPTTENPMYTVDVTTGVGDGNDGFAETIVIQNDKVHTDILIPNDLVDWFTFTIPGDTARNAIIEVSSAEKLSCIIYTPKDVDQFGFAGPQCEQSYAYQPGTYTIAVGRQRGPVEKQVTYSIKWK